MNWKPWTTTLSNLNYNWDMTLKATSPSRLGMYTQTWSKIRKTNQNLKASSLKSTNVLWTILDVVLYTQPRINIFEDLEPNYHFMDWCTPRTSWWWTLGGPPYDQTAPSWLYQILVDTQVDGFRFDMMETMTPLLSEEAYRYALSQI